MKKFYLITLYAFLASFGSYVSAETWTKVTTAPDDWSGEYLIVYEAGSVAFDGSRTTLDAASNIQSVTITNNQITTKDDFDFSFTIKATDGGYTIKSASGYYIGRTTNKNGLDSNKSTPYTNTLLLNTSGDISIKSSAGTYLQYNSDSNQKWFRYFGSNQKAIQLYKKVQAAPADQVAAPKFTVADGFSSFEPITASATTTTEGATVHYSYTKNGEPQTLADDKQAPVLSTVGTYEVTAFATDDTGTLKPSGPVTAKYIITAPAVPTAEPKPGTYSEATIIKFTSPEGTIVRVKRGNEYFTPVKNIFTKELTAVNGEKTTYTFEVWTEYNDNNSDRVFYTYTIDPNANKGIFARINSVEHFAANDKVIIVSEQARMIMSTYGSKAFNGEPASVEGSYTIPFGDNKISILTIENGAKAGTYKLKCDNSDNSDNSDYLNLSSSSKSTDITKATTGSENNISFKGNNVTINNKNNNTRSIIWSAEKNLFRNYTTGNIKKYPAEYYNVQLYKKLTGDGNLTARLRYHQNNEVIDAEENVADGMTYQNIGAILLSSETAVNYALVGEDGTQIGTTEPGKTSVLTFPGVGKYILATSNKVISFTIGSVVSGVETIAADAAKVYGAAGNIVVEAEAAADVNVYNAAGMLVAAQKVGAGRTNIALAKGFYVVRAGNTVTKVAVR